MTALAYGLLPALLVALALFVRRDVRVYRAFKGLTETADRQRQLRAWVVQSFLFFGVGGVAGLAAVGRLRDLVRVPPAFASLVSGMEGPDLGHLGPGLAIGGAIGLVLAFVAGRRASRRRTPPRPVKVGDIEPIMPRNAAERRWVALLSLNAGVSEEVFFRLLLPALFHVVVASAAFAFGASLVVFALIHAYQGWKGIVATLVLGALMTLVYLGSRSIAVAMAVHAAVDLNGLLLMPRLFRAQPSCDSEGS